MDIKLFLLMNCIIVADCQTTISNRNDAMLECALTEDIKHQMESMHLLQGNLWQEMKSEIEDIRQMLHVIQQQNLPRNGKH